MSNRVPRIEHTDVIVVSHRHVSANASFLLLKQNKRVVGYSDFSIAQDYTFNSWKYALNGNEEI